MLTENIAKNPVTRQHLDEMVRRILTNGVVEQALASRRNGEMAVTEENRGIERQLTQKTVVWFFNEAARHLEQAQPGTGVDVATKFPGRNIPVEEQKFPGAPVEITDLVRRVQLADLGANLECIFALLCYPTTPQFSLEPYFDEQNIGVHIYGRGSLWMFMNAAQDHNPWKNERGHKLVDEAIQIKPDLTAVENTALPDYS